MTNFILANMDLLGGILIAFVLITYAIITRQWSILKIAAYQLMLSAERLMTTDKGKAKFDVVFSALWDQVPAWFKKIVPENKLKEKLQDWYDIAKDQLKE